MVLRQRLLYVILVVGVAGCTVAAGVLLPLFNSRTVWEKVTEKPASLPRLGGSTTVSFSEFNGQAGTVYDITGTDWDANHDATTGSGYHTGNLAGQGLMCMALNDGGVMKIQRAVTFFNTSSIPDDATITSASFSFYVNDTWGPSAGGTCHYSIVYDDDFTYAGDTLSAADYGYTYYEAFCYNGSQTGAGQLNITFASTDFIVKNVSVNKGITTFMIRERAHDVNDSAPTTSQNYRMSCENEGAATLWVTYTSDEWVNDPPSFSSESPTNQTTNQARWPTTAITITDDDTNQTLDVDWYYSTTEITGPWTYVQGNTSTGTATVTFRDVNASYASIKGETYYWKVTCNDGVTNVSEVNWFTIENYPPFYIPNAASALTSTDIHARSNANPAIDYVVHADLLYFTNGWGDVNGSTYKYWFTTTGYSGSGDNDDEQPCILVTNNISNDSWVEPAGNYYETNPISGYYYTGAGQYADQDTIYNDDTDEIWLYVCNQTAGTLRFWEIYTTSDGVNWTKLCNLSFNGAYHEPQLLSLAVLKDGSSWGAWAVNITPSPNHLVYFTSSDGRNWTTAYDCGFSFRTASTRDLWHLNVIKYNDEYWMILHECSNGTSGSLNKMAFAISTDGGNWTGYDEEVMDLGTGGSWDDAQVYRGDWIIYNGNLTCIYTGYDGSLHWHAGWTYNSSVGTAVGYSGNSSNVIIIESSGRVNIQVVNLWLQCGNLSSRVNSQVSNLWLDCGNTSGRMNSQVSNLYLLCGNSSSRENQQVINLWLLCGNETTRMNTQVVNLYLSCGNDTGRVNSQVVNLWLSCGNASTRVNAQAANLYLLCGNTSIRASTQVSNLWLLCGDDTGGRVNTQVVNLYLLCGNDTGRVNTQAANIWLQCENTSARVNNQVANLWLLCGNTSDRANTQICNIWLQCGNERQNTRVCNIWLLCGNTSLPDINLTVIYPMDGTSDVPPNATIIFYITQTDGHPVNITIWRDNHTVYLGGYTQVHNGTYMIASSAIEAYQLYNCSINVTDGTQWRNETIAFQTGIAGGLGIVVGMPNILLGVIVGVIVTLFILFLIGQHQQGQQPVQRQIQPRGRLQRRR